MIPGLRAAALVLLRGFCRSLQRGCSRAGVARACGALLLTLGLSPAVAQPLVYELLPEHSFVHFEVMHFGTSTIRGRFGPLQGTVMLDRQAASGEVGLRVATAGVSTGLSFFDARLRQADLLASVEFPEAFFVARNFRFVGQQLAEVRGEFTWRGTSRPLSLHALRFGCRAEADPARPDAVCGGDFEGELLRSEYGSTFGLPFVADRVRLVVQVEGRRR